MLFKRWTRRFISEQEASTQIIRHFYKSKNVLSYQWDDALRLTIAVRVDGDILRRTNRLKALIHQVPT